ncbi:hypothetical protein CTI12_AA269200 [Artemisia annua]|uniref:Transmembrane protein n=1 Tax=Artemisia annua TaxID=35608 RepID=A0A2U1NGE9_ARTAN|nr:hypothetical protein CTI12_AA269200 [Artemisia annua]
MENFCPKLIISLFVLSLILDHHHANGVHSDNDSECTQRSRKLIQGWQQKVMAPKSERKLRGKISPPGPQANRFRSLNMSPPPPPLPM